MGYKIAFGGDEGEGWSHCVQFDHEEYTCMIFAYPNTIMKRSVSFFGGSFSLGSNISAAMWTTIPSQGVANKIQG